MPGCSTGCVLSAEIDLVVVTRTISLRIGRGNPTLSIRRKAVVLGAILAMRPGHHRGLRLGHAFTGVAWGLGRSKCVLASEREGEPGHGVLLKGHTGDTLRSPTLSTNLQQSVWQATIFGACRAAKLCATRGGLSGFQSGERAKPRNRMRETLAPGTVGERRVTGVSTRKYKVASDRVTFRLLTKILLAITTHLNLSTF